MAPVLSVVQVMTALLSDILSAAINGSGQGKGSVVKEMVTQADR